MPFISVRAKNLTDPITSRLGGLERTLALIGQDNFNKVVVHPDQVAVVSDADYELGLSFSDRAYYRVYDLDGEIEYELTNHSGNYGRHLIDKVYISSLREGTLFYINYQIDKSRYFETLLDREKIILAIKAPIVTTESLSSAALRADELNITSN